MTKTGYTNSLKFLLNVYPLLHTCNSDVNTASETVYVHEITQL